MTNINKLIEIKNKKLKQQQATLLDMVIPLWSKLLQNKYWQTVFYKMHIWLCRFTAS